MKSDAIKYELERVDKELIRLRQDLKKWNSRRRELWANLVQNAMDAEEESFQYGNKTFILTEKVKSCGRKSEKDKRNEALAILSEEGYHGADADTVYERLNEAFKSPQKVEMIFTEQKK